MHPRRVLRLAKLRAGGHLYYFEPLGLDGRQPVEPPGSWAGRGAAVLGLAGIVEPGELEAVLAGTDVDGTGLPGADRRRVVVTGFDLIFCAPKSVSVLQGLGDSEVAARVQHGHDRAVDAALGYLEDRALTVRRALDTADSGHVRLPEPAEGSPAAAFVHHTSRALDPHLHTHVVLANVGRGPDRRWSALDGRGLYAHASAAGALYHAQLRHELTTRLGVAWGPLDRGRADVAGIGPEVRRAFSRRSEEIAAHLADRGLVPDGPGRPSPRAVTVAGHATRAPKDLGVGADELRPHWRARAQALGLGPRRLDAMLDRVATPQRIHPEAGRALDDEVDSRAVAEALATVRAPAGGFTRRDVVRAWAGATPSGAPAHAVAAVVDGFLDDVRGEPGHAVPGSDPRRRVGRGVAEERLELPERLRRRELERLLERRGMGLVPERPTGRHRGLALDAGLGLG